MTKQAESPPDGGRSPSSAPPSPPAWRHWLWPLALLAALLLWLFLPAVHSSQVTLNYTQFLSKVSAHQVKTASIGSDGRTTTGTLANGTTYTTVIPQQAGSPLLGRLEAAKVQITASRPGPSFWSQLLSWLIIVLPFLLLGWLWLRLSRGAGGQLQGVLGVGRSRAKVFDAERPGTTFADVAGYEGPKAEIAETVDFLRNPGRYRRAGATPPRGVLMVGPPGTGKTLMARAVAGEAKVPFFSVVGSSFVERVVGVGAARVRDLFTEARKRAPTIIFIDELDAIGQKRGGSAMVSNDEREQTLNQMLSEMDGFDPDVGIVVLAATNRPEVLDPALLRPGRFDRQITIPLPNVAERTAILAVHCRGKRLDPRVDMSVIARGTPGFSGADLANLVNEAAICAARDNRDVLLATDFDTALDRILLGGRRQGSNVLLPEEKHSVAVHEAGHALVAALSPRADPVAKVTILPAGQALGVTEQLPLVERHLYGEEYLNQTLAVRLGGRAAELVELGEGSTGAASDLASATGLATKMVREFGLSPKLGPVGYPEGASVFLGGGGAAVSSRPFAEATEAAIDSEVSRLLREAEQRATTLLHAHQAELRKLAALLQEHETVDGDTVYRLAGMPPPKQSPDTTVAPRQAAVTSSRASRGAASADGGPSRAEADHDG